MLEVQEKTKESKTVDFKIDLEEMAKAGVHFGHCTSKVRREV